MADLLKQPQAASAIEAVDYFCYQAAKHLAALTVSLGGLDRLVFTGGIGARSPEIRARICARLAYLGVDLAVDRNTGGDTIISKPAGSVIIEAFETDEELVIARHVQATLAAQPPMFQEA